MASGQEPQALAGEEYEAYDRAVSWLSKVELHFPNDPEAQRNLVDVLMCKAEFETMVKNRPQGVLSWLRILYSF